MVKTINENGMPTRAHLVNQVQLLNRNAVDLVEDIEAWHVDAVALNDINEIIGPQVGCSEGNLGVVNLVPGKKGSLSMTKLATQGWGDGLAHQQTHNTAVNILAKDGFDSVGIHVALLHCCTRYVTPYTHVHTSCVSRSNEDSACCSVGALAATRTFAPEGNTALVLALKVNVRQAAVDSNAKALQLLLNQALVGHGFHGIQHDHDHVASARCANHLATTTLAIFGTFNDTWQVQQLNLGSLWLGREKGSWHASVAVCVAAVVVV